MSGLMQDGGGPIFDNGLLAEGLQSIPEVLTETGIPGCAVLVCVEGTAVARAAWGWAVRPGTGGGHPAERMRVDTLVDVASITKVAATTAVAMTLVEGGELDLDAPISSFVPELRQAGMDQLTARLLLTHRSGLPAWAPLFLECRDADQAVSRIGGIPLQAPPGTRTVYSDLGMSVLGVVLERQTGARLNELARDRVFDPLGMNATQFGPLRESVRCAATSIGNPVECRMIPAARRLTETASPHWWRSRTLVGEVNDANAAIAFDGVSGHAGLFSTIDDLATFGRALLGEHGNYGCLFSTATVHEFTTPGVDRDQALGFWTRRLANGLGRTLHAPDRSFGHRGFTGCELLVSPDDQLVVVMLTNRLHADDPPPEQEPLWALVLRATSRLFGTWR